jgi:hypothetical protein
MLTKRRNLELQRVVVSEKPFVTIAKSANLVSGFYNVNAGPDVKKGECEDENQVSRYLP